MNYKSILLILLTLSTGITIFVSNSLNQPINALEIPDVENNDEPSDENLSAITNVNETTNDDEFALKVTLDKQDSLVDNFIMYEVEGFGLNVSPNSKICPTNNCEFELEDGKLSSVFAGQYLFNGVLKVGVEEEEGTRSNVMSISSSLNIRETLENDDTTTEFLTGDFKLGEPGTVIISPDLSYRVTNGSLVIEDGEATMILQGER